MKIEHNVSIDLSGGRECNVMEKKPLQEVLRKTLSLAPEDKHDCWLISNGYSDKGGYYTRAEFNFQWIDTILIDCDNDKESPDPTMLERFKEEFDKYAYFLWETASSTPACPKFRAIILLDRKIPWINEPEKFTKRAIKERFSRWTDDNASWYFTPTKSKVHTFIGHKGVLYPSYNITSLVTLYQQVWNATRHTEGFSCSHASPTTMNPEGWRRLPSVKKCLEGLHKGERDNSLNAACYAMDNNGYHDRIGDFLNEVVCDESIKRKFRAKYK